MLEGEEKVLYKISSSPEKNPIIEALGHFHEGKKVYKMDKELS